MKDGRQGTAATAALDTSPLVRALVRVAAAARELNDVLPVYIDREPLRRALAQLDLDTGSDR